MFAEEEFKLSLLQPDGKTLREHLEAVERITKKRPEQLTNRTELPDSMVSCWKWFLALNNTRSTGFGASPITYTEMWCYFNLNDIEPTKWELDVIKMFDSISMAMNKEQEEKNKNKKKVTQ